MKKFNFIFDNTKKAKILKRIIFRKYKNYSIKKSDVIVVAGGDGFMLKTIKKFYKFNKPFYGINCGSIGFLLNKYVHKKLYKKIGKAKVTTIYPLQVNTVSKGKKRKSFLALNELSLLRQSKQTAFLKLRLNQKILIKKLIGDGVLLSTPAGSTAYNLSVNGPILSLNSKKLAITPISPFRPRRWRGKIVGDSSKIIIRNLNIKKRPISAVADNIEVRNAKIITVQKNKKIKFDLLYDNNSSLQKKIKLEQIRKETN